MMPQETKKVSDALVLACFRSGVSPDDGSDWAASQICSMLAKEDITGEPSSPTDCPVTNWLKRHTGFTSDSYRHEATLILVGTRNVSVHGPRVRGKRPLELVPMPAAIVAAIGRITQKRREVA